MGRGGDGELTGPHDRAWRSQCGGEAVRSKGGFPHVGARSAASRRVPGGLRCRVRLPCMVRSHYVAGVPSVVARGVTWRWGLGAMGRWGEGGEITTNY